MMLEYRVLQIYSQTLKRNVRIFVYVPKEYNNSLSSYPVLYMHDGHNLFDDNTATYGNSWKILETFDKNLTLPNVIIVGIDSTKETRMSELSPYKFNYNEKDITGKANIYLDFIVETVKPYIDLNFRTLKDPFNTAIMGSSLGGVTSTYAAIKYQNTFTRFGCVSNAYFLSYIDLKNDIFNANLNNINKIYLDVGTKESKENIENEKYLESNRGIYIALKSKIDSNKIMFKTIENAKHNEIYWGKRFKEILNYIFS